MLAVIKKLKTLLRHSANPPIVPSLPARSGSELQAWAESLEGTASILQIDIVDGVFANPASWPFVEDDVETAWSQLLLLQKDFEVEVDCMVREPLHYLNTLIEHGVQRVVVHWGSMSDVDPVIEHARLHGYQLGLAITNDDPLKDVLEVVPEFAWVQVMGIAQVGTQGQGFDPRTIRTVRELHMRFPKLVVAVDGSVNAATLPLLKLAGAGRFAPGSAISRADDPVQAYKQLFALATQ